MINFYAGVVLAKTIYSFANQAWSYFPLSSSGKPSSNLQASIN